MVVSGGVLSAAVEDDNEWRILGQVWRKVDAAFQCPRIGTEAGQGLETALPTMVQDMSGALRA
jgi:hypothetical protein